MPAVASHLPPQPAAPGCRRLGEGVPSGAAVPCQEGGRRWQPALALALALARSVRKLVNQVSGAPAPPIQPPLQPHPCPAKPLGDEETLLYSQPAAQASPEPREREEGVP